MAKGKPSKYDGLVRLTARGEPAWTGRVDLDPKKLADPLRWTRPRKIFVDSMSDLFHESLSNEQIAAVFGVMAAARQHTFQVLTKRAKRMCEWFEWIVRKEPVAHARSIAWAYAFENLKGQQYRGTFGRGFDIEERMRPNNFTWPLPNVWLGVSVENQAAADERIPELLATPAAIRFLSCEPLLGPLMLQGDDPLPAMRCRQYLRGVTGDQRVSWVIAGCESGPDARPCDVAWLRSLRDQCARAGVPFFLKQAVEEGRDEEWECSVTAQHGSRRKAGGVIELPYLDGVQHAAFPEVDTAGGEP
jgi:protein gp37